MKDMTDKELNLLILQIAKTCHSVNKAYCDHNGDTSQVDWDKAEEWQKKSAISGVIYTLENPTTTPEEQHEAWMKSKIADGWVYGEVKDSEKKTHPSLLPYNELPESEKLKDKLFKAVVNSFTTTK